MDFVKAKQSFLEVPSGKGFTSQHFVVTENDAVIVDVSVPVAPADSDLPTYWVEVASNRVRSLTYLDAAGNETTATSTADVVADKFAGPAPAGFGDETQLDQRTSDTRPTD